MVAQNLRIVRVAFVFASLVSGLVSCKGGCRPGYVEEPTPPATSTSVAKGTPPEKDEEEEEEGEEGEESEANEEAEKAEMMKPQFWRVKVVITGEGLVTSYDRTVECGDDGAHHGTSCGPTAWTQPLAGFKPAPSVLTAFAAPGWRLSKWEAVVHHADGRVTPRKKTSVRDFYVNYFKPPHDPADLEVVTAVFTKAPAAGSSASTTADGGAAPKASTSASATSAAKK
jgi:hypothetical protein